MAQNEQTTEEHSTLEQQSPGRLDHPACVCVCVCVCRESGEKRRNASRKARARESERCWAGFVFVLVSAGVTQSVGDCYLRLADAEYRPRFCCVAESRVRLDRSTTFTPSPRPSGGTVAEWLACWTLAQKGLDSNRSRDTVG